MLKIGFAGRVLVVGTVSGFLGASGACGGGSTNLFNEPNPPAGSAGSSGSSGTAGGSSAAQCERTKDCNADQQCVAGQCTPTGTGAGGGVGVGGSNGAGNGPGGSTGAGGGSGSHDSGGSGGSSGQGGSSGGGGNPREGGGGPPLIVEYLCNGTAPSNSTIAFHVRITNNSDSDVPLAGLSIRYYLTNETEATPIVEMDYGAVSAPYQSVTSHLASMCSAYGPKATANTVCEVMLSDLEPLSPGANLELQLRIHTPEYQLLNQANDYSFDPTKTMFAPWEHVTVYRMGALLAGAQP